MPDHLSSRDAVAEVVSKLSAEGDSDAPDAAGVDRGHDTSAADTAPATELHDSAGASDAPDAEAQRTRDPQGRFAKEKARKAAAAKAAEAQPEPTPVVDPAALVVPAPSAAPELKPPQDWRAGAKEKWKTLPREVQEEAGRVYAETRKVLDENANLRKATEPLRQTFAQHEHVFRAAGAPVHQVIGGLLRSLSVLQTGHPQARADVVAGIARAYLGTDESALRLLAAALDAGPQATAQAPQALTPQQIRDLVRQERQAGEAQSRQQSAVQLVDEFKSSAEYFDQVQPEMQAIATSWRARNPSGQVTKEVLKQWYDRACELNEETAPIMKQRKDAAAAKAKASTPAAAAAAGIKSEPAGPSGGISKAKTTREEVARQVARLSSGRARV